ncbi:MAG: hypothetical protein EBT71_07775, partial [Alphaproteobacteria bacterium]|nr:hypothetical protein [Alphaproteobacteria bacterium]
MRIIWKPPSWNTLRSATLISPLSGKTTCLHLLEDLEYYCVDNIPASLLPALAKRLADEQLHLARVAVSIDARNISDDLRKFPHIYESLRADGIDTQIIFLDAD